MNERIRDFKDLRVWQKGIELVKDVYKVTKNFPKDELYGIMAQLRRAAVSIPSNIAEGFRRKYSKEHKHFLSMALGSCAEVETLAVISKELNYMTVGEFDIMIETIDHICGMLVNLYKRV